MSENGFKINYPKLIFAILLSIYFFSVAYAPLNGSYLDLVDLPIHEAGHLFFRPLGDFMMIAGGTLFQLIVPAIFVGYFFWKEQYYSAAAVLFWLGQSFLNVYVYANDAIVMRLVLLGGFTGSEGAFHDWNFMLRELGLINSTATVAGLIRLTGTLLIIAAAVLTVRFSFSKDK
ncbi:MAG: hypothetical protein KIS76_13120 [Pyrinomonadaceae bacterium]|nr:hypothetical protein [Pyrinomonadaceae bacterium]